jgi:hypothetical protein
MFWGIRLAGTLTRANGLFVFGTGAAQYATESTFLKKEAAIASVRRSVGSGNCKCLSEHLLIYPIPGGNWPSVQPFVTGQLQEEAKMRKLSIALAALATIAVAAPTIANAGEEIGVRIGGDHHRDRGEFREHREFRGARAEFRDHDRGWHRGWDHDRGSKKIIIKHRHDHDRY